jgi:transcriptional regulator with XRE-family HTH domain
MNLDEMTGSGASDTVRGPSLAERLKAYRKKRGISQSQAARELDIARTAYRLWELEAAHPSPDRWRLVARWLGVSMTTLLLAEGLISEEEGRRSEEASAKFEAEAGGSPDVAAEQEPGDFFRQAQAMLDRSLERGIITADEAGTFRDTFARIQAALSQGTRS